MRAKNFDEQYDRAKKAGELANQSEPRAVSAQYDNRTKLIIVYLHGGNTFTFSPKWVPSLREASAPDLSNIEVTPSGTGLHWANLDEDLSVPALLQGNFGPAVAGVTSIPVDTELFENLCVQIEIAWNTNHDASVVDRLASEHPDLSADLYDFLTLLIETDLMEPEADAFQQTAENTLAWLEKEGFEIVHQIAKEQRNDTTHATPLDSTPNQSKTASSYTSDNELNPGEDTYQLSSPLAFMAIARKRTGLDDDEITEKMDTPAPIIKFVQGKPVGTYTHTRREIIQRAKAVGVGGQEAEEAIYLELQNAARRRTNRPHLTLKELIEKIPLPPEKKIFWLSLADKDENL